MRIKLYFITAVSVIAILSVIEACQHDPLLIEGGRQNTTGTGPVNIDTVSFDINSVPCNENTVYFRNQILPVFVSNCAISGCHDSHSSREGVVTTDYQHIMRGISPGDLNGSKYYRVLITSDREELMPRQPGTERGYSLPQDQLDLIRTWILQGAKNNACNSCDTTQFTFAGRIQGIIEQNCATSSACHGQGSANGSLTSYNNVKAFVDSDLIQKRVIVYRDMPPASPLADCDRLIIKKWIEEGALNN